MFIFSANNLRSFLWLVSVLAVLVVGTGGCGSDEEDEPWVGTWSLQTVDGQDWRAIFLILGGKVEDKWTFKGDGTWELELALTILDEKETTRLAGTYTLTDDTFSMVVTSDPDGAIFDFDIEDPSEQSSGFDEEAGTWVRDGNTLTLTDSDGQVLVFKKR